MNKNNLPEPTQLLIVVLCVACVVAVASAAALCTIKSYQRPTRYVLAFSIEDGWDFLHREAAARGKTTFRHARAHVRSDFAPFQKLTLTAQDAKDAQKKLVNKTLQPSFINLIKLGVGSRKRIPGEFEMADSVLKRLNRCVTIVVNYFDEPVSRPSASLVTDEDAQYIKSLETKTPFFTDPNSFRFIDHAFPFFSNTKPTRGPYLDVIACHVNNGAYVSDILKVKSFPAVPWSEKQARLVWRGSSTGGAFSGVYPAEHYPRLRILDWAKTSANRDRVNIDVAITEHWGNLPSDKVIEKYPLGSFQRVKEQFKAKYLLVIDGHTWPNRLAAFLHAGSVVLLATIFEDWVSRKLKPWVHYVPVQIDFSDLDEKLTWLLDNDAEAEKIGERGKAFAERELDMESMKLYNAAVVLEYSRVFEL